MSGCFSQPTVTPCLRGLMRKQKQKVNCWDSSGALGTILSHGLKLLQWTRKELRIRARVGSCSCFCLGSHSFQFLCTCSVLKIDFVEYQNLVPFCRHPLALSGTSQWCFLSVSVLLVGSSAQSHITLYSTGEFELCLFLLGSVLILAGCCLLLFE